MLRLPAQESPSRGDTKGHPRLGHPHSPVTPESSPPSQRVSDTQGSHVGHSTPNASLPASWATPNAALLQRAD